MTSQQLRCFSHLWVREVIQSLLVGAVCFLQIIHHQKAMTQVAPGLAIVWFAIQDLFQILHCLRILLFGSKDTRDGIQGLCRPFVMTKCLFISEEGSVEVAGKLIQRTCDVSDSPSRQ